MLKDFEITDSELAELEVPAMNHLDTKYRVSSRSYIQRGIKTYVGRVRFYEKDQFLFSESTGIHRTNPEDAQADATKIAMERLAGA